MVVRAQKEVEKWHQQNNLYLARPWSTSSMAAIKAFIITVGA
jgi:hypothetical protein